MKEKIKQHYLKLGSRPFVIGAVILLLVMDLLNSAYLRLYWLKKDLSTTLVHEMVRKNGYVLENFSRDTIMEMKGFLDNTFYFFLFLILINNIFFYFFYLRKKLWAQGYILFYTLTGSVFSLSFLIDQADLGVMWFIYNILTIFIYLYLYFGVKLLKYETTDVIPEHER